MNADLLDAEAEAPPGDVAILRRWWTRLLWNLAAIAAIGRLAYVIVDWLAEQP